MSNDFLFTSESVSDGHPDKLADRISDAVLDRCLALDPNAKVACETLLTDDLVVVAGEFRLAPEGTFEQVQRELDGLAQAVRDVFDLTPAGIIRDLDLRRPIYAATAAYGHFGREDEAGFTWGRTDRVGALCDALGVPTPSVDRQDQRDLSRFVREAESDAGPSPEMQAWWWNRY